MRKFYRLTLRRISVVLLCGMMAISGFPADALAVDSEKQSPANSEIALLENESNVTYLDENGMEKSCDSATVIESGTTIWGANDGQEHWYVARDIVTITDHVTVQGNVHLILENGCNLTASSGINVQKDASFCIYAQSDEEAVMGSLNAGPTNRYEVHSTKRDAGDAGIGGSCEDVYFGDIVINGGKITATGGNNAAGIGSSGYQKETASGEIIDQGEIVDSTITINGGIVVATAGNDGAGIGSGLRVESSIDVIINGGNVTAQGGLQCAGIGNSLNSIHGGDPTVTITGGTVKATGWGGAGIGSGVAGYAVDITITGGNVEAYSTAYSYHGESECGAGIGGGQHGCVGNIIISGGNVKATSTYNVGIGNGMRNQTVYGNFSTGENGNAVIYTDSISDRTYENEWSGIIFLGTEGAVYGDVTLSDNLTIPVEDTLTVRSEASLTIPNQVTLNVKGNLINEGTVTGGGAISPEEKKLLPSLSITAELDKAYDGEPVTLDNTGYTYNGNAMPVITWYRDANGNIGESLSSAPVDVGTYWVKVSAGATGIYQAAEASNQFTISKGDSTVATAPVASKGLVYTGQPQALVTEGAAAGGTMVYALGTDDTTAPDSYDGSIPQGTDAGTYYVWYKVQGNGNHADSTPAFVEVTIAKATPALALTASPESLYGGGNVTLTLSGLPSGGSATVTCDKSITVTANSDGTWTADLPNQTTDYTFTASYDGDGNHNSAEVTCTVSVTRYSSGGGSSTPTYRPDVEQPDNGDVTVTPRNLERGDKVTVTPEPGEGYEVDEITVTDRDGDEVEVTDNGDGTWSFTQPSGKVTITVTFREIGEEPESLPFTDVPEGHWAYDAVRYVYEHGLMAGTSGSTFDPGGTTTRGQIVTILWRLSGSPVVNYLMDFSDVDPAAWYGEAIRWAASEGIATGYGNGTFGPNDPITREQLAVMLYRYAQHEGYDTTQGGMAIREYADYDQISDFALEALNWAVSAGIISGTSPTTLDPQGTATRAQSAVILMRFCELDK